MSLLVRTTLSILAAAPLALGVTGCGSTGAEIPSERIVLAPTERVLWEALYVSITDEKYGIGGGADPSDRTITTGWKLDLAPYRSQGFRTRVIATYERADPGPEVELEGYDVSIRVEKETNESYQSLDPRYAKWEAAPDDAETARRIMQRLTSYLGTEEIDVSTRDDPLEPNDPFDFE
ncbi:MAG: hypothetical protein AAGA20_15055 [Planctomycetota bacterium]